MLVAHNFAVIEEILLIDRGKLFVLWTISNLPKLKDYDTTNFSNVRYCSPLISAVRYCM